MTTVTVLVPAHNEAAAITATVACVRAQNYPVARLVVIADACSDDTAGLARGAGAEVLETVHGSKSLALSQAFATVDTDVTVVIDSDTLLASDALALMVADIEAGYDGTCATVLPRQQGGMIPRARAFSYALARRWHKLAQRNVGRLWVLSGCAFMVRTDTLRSIGGFVVAPISEDGHTTWQLYRAGARLTYTPAAMAYTMEPESWGEWYRQQLRWASGFFQIQRAYWREFRHPSTLLVIGGMMVDLILAPLTYGGTLWATATGHLSPVPLVAWLAVFNIATLILASTVIGPRRALANFLPHKIVAVATTSMYLVCGVREWLLGKHLGSWTGRHGFKSQYTPMPWRRKAVATLGVSLFTDRGTRPRRGRYRADKPVSVLANA